LILGVDLGCLVYTLSMKRIAIALSAYGSFLILTGLTGYLSNPEKAKTALLSGGTFGLLHIALGWLAHRGWRASSRVALGTAGLLGGVFVWRTTVTWMAVAGGHPEKRTAALLITGMLTATVAIIVFLVRSRKRANSPSS
jgi:uncharacterized membrane protein (UPF0136 family)